MSGSPRPATGLVAEKNMHLLDSKKRVMYPRVPTTMDTTYVVSYRIIYK